MSKVMDCITTKVFLANSFYLKKNHQLCRRRLNAHSYIVLYVSKRCVCLIEVCANQRRVWLRVALFNYCKRVKHDRAWCPLDMVQVLHRQLTMRQAHATDSKCTYTWDDQGSSWDDTGSNRGVSSVDSLGIKLGWYRVKWRCLS